jgi:hypothetical protein
LFENKPSGNPDADLSLSEKAAFPRRNESLKKLMLETDQGDQIGRIVFFGQCFENYRSSANFWTTLLHGASYVLILTKTMVGIQFGRLFHELIWSP